MTPAVPFPLSAPPRLLQAVLDVSLTGFIVFRPLYAPADPAIITDLAYVYLNPAAQQMLRLPECPVESFLTLYPSTVETGIFAFYRDTYVAGETRRYDVNYQHDGLDNYYQLVACRSGELLVVSFSDTAGQPRTAVKTALRESQVREQQARAEADAQRQRLHDVLLALPAQVATTRGPDHAYELVNPRYQQLFGARCVQGLPMRQALPELIGQGILEQLDQVYRTGEPYADAEQEAWVDVTGTGRPEQRYFSVLFQALRDGQGSIDGILSFAYDVTEQVLARRQVQQLNQELEARVFERTQALRHAQAEAVAAAQRLLRVTESLPSTTFTTDPSGQVLYISPQWYAYTGMALGSPISETWPRLIHPDDLPAIAREFGAALAEGRPWSYEFRLRGADGEYRWFASQGVPEPLEEAEAAGRPRQWFGSNLDIHALKQAQHQLELKDQQLTSILAMLPAAVATFEGHEYRCTFFNDTHQRLFGKRARLGGSISEIYPEVVPQGFVGLLDEMRTTGQPFVGTDVPATVEVDGRTQQFYIDFVYQPMPEAQGVGILAFAVDVTERVHTRQRAEVVQTQALATAEQAATQREAFYRVFEQTPALVVLLRSPGHRVEYANPAYQAVFPGRALVGLDMAVALPELQEQGFIDLLNHVYQTGETYFGTDTPFTVPARAGPPARVAYYNFTYQAYRENGQVAGISIFAFDTTEQVLARQEREAQQRQLQAVFAQAPVAVCVFRGEDNVLDVVNPPMAEMLGHPLPALVGQPFFEVLPELRSQRLAALLANVRRTGVPFVAQEQKITLARHRPHEPGYYNLVYQPLLDARHGVTDIVCVATDVTEQVRARQRVQELNEQLAAINEELQAANEELGSSNQQLTRTNVDLDNFIYTASHDLKAPISNLEGLLYLLREELPAAVAQSEYVAPTLTRMLDAVERFKRTIDHLTEVSKLQKEHAPVLASLDLAAVVEDVRLDLAPLLRDTNAQLTVAVADFPPILFSEKNLRSVVYNLLSNALKYRHPARRPHVDVRAHLRPGFTVLEVHDNGLGLDAPQVPRLFTMFQRFHSHVEGTGIGLFMVKRMVENAGGRVEVHSQLGAGTTFFVYLPRVSGFPAV